MLDSPAGSILERICEDAYKEEVFSDHHSRQKIEVSGDFNNYDSYEYNQEQQAFYGDYHSDNTPKFELVSVILKNKSK